MIGTKLGIYEIREEVGRGGMATVYRAYQPTVDRDVAIKVILKGIAGDAGAVQRFQREARLIARLEHPYILPVYDFDGAHKLPYIVMRYLDSGTLKTVLAQGLLPPDEVTYLMRQICSGVDYAHRQGIVHRDIKPSNIMIDRDGNAFVTDFGLARLTAPMGDDAQITESGVVMGTPEYMAPEQALGMDNLDARVDIYALGVMLFQMLTGKMPFSAPSAMGILLMHAQEPIPSVRALNPDLPPDVDMVIQQAMAKRQEDRYATAAALSAAITEILGGTLTTTPSQLRKANTLLLQRVGSKRVETRSRVTFSAQNKMVVTLSAKATEYAEIIEEGQGGEVAQQAMTALWSAFEQLVNERNGRVFSRTDTELLALWGAESAHEDDTERAIRAALAMQQTLREMAMAFLEKTDNPLPLNIGLNSGLALLTLDEKTGTLSASGATLNLANRLMQMADGAILISHEVFRQILGIFDVQPDEPLKLRGREEAIRTYRVLAAKTHAIRLRVRGIEGIETRLIGRDAELKIIQKALLSALEDNETQAVTIVAEAGIGKSRLLYEFAKWTELRPETFRIFRGRATADMNDRPYALIRDLVSFRFEILDNDPPGVVRQKMEDGLAALVGPEPEMAHTIGYLCGFDFADSPHVKGLLEDAQQLVRRARLLFVRLFTRLAKAEQVIVELEDIHAADDLSLDLLNEVVTADAGLHLMIIATARPTLYERRPTWGSGQPFHTRLDLKPLDKRDSRELVREILQKVPDVPKVLRDLLVERAEGNPYYLEELVKTLIDKRVIVKDSDSVWRIEESRLDTLAVPSTLLGLLESRLDTLLYPEKLTLQRAVVIGRIFYDTALAALDAADETHISGLSHVLDRLPERGFIEQRETTAFAGSIEYIFGSAILRDTVYHALLRRQIAIYNHAAAEWLQSAAGGRANEYAPQIADYYERAGERERAGEILQAAGERARKIGAYREARVLLTRALALLPETAEAVRQAATLQLGRVARTLGDYTEASTMLEMALTLARRRADTDAQAVALRTMASLWIDKGDLTQAARLLQDARALTGVQPTTQADVSYELGFLAYQTGDSTRLEELAQESLIAARASGNVRALNNAVQLLGIAAVNRGDYTGARGFFEQGIDLAKEMGNRDVLGAAYNNLGELHRQQGNYTAARAAFQESLPLSRETGSRFTEVTCLSNLGMVALVLRDSVAAREHFRVALRLSYTAGMSSSIEEALASLAGVRALEGDTETALKWLGLALGQPTVIGENRHEVDEVFAILREMLSEDEIQRGMERGKSLDFEATIAALLAEG